MLTLATATGADDLNLPELGSSGAGIVTEAQEYEIGQQWQRVFRARSETSNDPFVRSYIESLVKRLAYYSDLRDKRLDILIAENPALNAFAVPGGVVGINTGLFLYAETEQQFSSVVAHELAHLSQRHFARQLEEQKNNSVPNLVGILASILILATAGGDAGIAALSTTQAVAIDQQLRFSRTMEQEADRVGMETIVRAGMNPTAMADMFESMLHASRFQSKAPEFLITHPLTESRVSDAKLRAQQFPRRQEQLSLDYQLTKTRVEIGHSSNLVNTVQRYQTLLKTHPAMAQIARYGIAESQLRLKQFEAANRAFSDLLAENDDQLHYIVGLAEAHAGMGNFDKAKKVMESALSKRLGNHVLVVKLAEIYMQSGDYKKGQTLLSKHAKFHAKDEYVWYLLAETHGLAGNIFKVHTARSEYFKLNGLYKKSARHLRQALSMLKEGDARRAALEKKLKDILAMEREQLI
jgi:predicted Zn-dependent protease